MTLTAEDIQAVASLTAHDPAHVDIPNAQTKHRFDLIASWNIPEGASVLELGCGQGDCTAVLAHVVGPNGHVTAIDPGPIDTYGSPLTLAQAQAHLSAGPLGSRITWVEADPIAFLKSHPDAKYDFAVLAHCCWYFPSPTTLTDTLRALTPHAAHIAIAEWALSGSSLNAVPHVLAAFVQATLYLLHPSTDSNIRSILSPLAIKEAAAQCGMTLLTEQIVTPDVSLQDGRWEVGAVTSDSFLDTIRATLELEKDRCVLYALRDSILTSVAALKAQGERVRSMDAWTAVLVPAHQRRQKGKPLRSS